MSDMKPVDEREEEVARLLHNAHLQSFLQNAGYDEKARICGVNDCYLCAFYIHLIEQRDEARRENRPYMITCPWCAADMRDTSNPRQVVHLIHCGDMRWESMKQERDAAVENLKVHHFPVPGCVLCR